jgi:hypothetical protein
MDRFDKALLEVSLDEITPEVLGGVSDEGLAALMGQLHEMWAEIRRRNLLTPSRKEALVNRAVFVRREMKRRGLDVTVSGELDEEVAKLDRTVFESGPRYDLEAVAALAAGLSPAVLVECYAAASGSLLDGTGEDVTVHLRTSERDASTELKMFRTVNAVLDRFPEFDRNPDFAVEGKVPVWDLVLRPCSPVVREVDGPESRAQESDKNTKGIGRLPSVVLVPDFVSVSGSFLYHAEGRAPADIDIIYKSPRRDPVLESALRRQLSEAVPHLDAHFVWEQRGPNWSHVPLFDLVARRTSDEITEARRIELPPNVVKDVEGLRRFCRGRKGKSA